MLHKKNVRIVKIFWIRRLSRLESKPLIIPHKNGNIEQHSVPLQPNAALNPCSQLLEGRATPVCETTAHLSARRSTPLYRTRHFIERDLPGPPSIQVEPSHCDERAPDTGPIIRLDFCDVWHLERFYTVIIFKMDI